MLARCLFAAVVMDILDSGSEAGQVVGETLDEVQP